MPPSSCWFQSISLDLAATCSSLPRICWRSWSTCSRSCAFWPSRAERRSSNSRCSLVVACATSGSLRRARSSSGKVTLSAPSRSATRRACRESISSSALVTMARLVRACVSSSRTTMSPFLTRSPSLTLSSPTTPPVGCCTFLTLLSTTSLPGAMTAPEISLSVPQPKMTSIRTATAARPSPRWPRSDCWTVTAPSPAAGRRHAPSSAGPCVRPALPPALAAVAAAAPVPSARTPAGGRSA